MFLRFQSSKNIKLKEHNLTMKTHNLNGLYSGPTQSFLGIGKNSQNCEESVCDEVHFNVIVDMQYLC